jgi:SPP1 family predicted phage head-tail adaptor
MGTRYSIAQFKHRVAICTMRDVVESDGQMSLSRKDVYHAWAAITPMTGTLYSRAGQAVDQSRETRTHKICIRFRRDVDFSQTAWLYEERLQSGARWFKMLAMHEQNEAGEYLEMDCRLVSRGDDLSAPVVTSVAAPLPQGVKL